MKQARESISRACGVMYSLVRCLQLQLHAHEYYSSSAPKASYRLLLVLRLHFLFRRVLLLAGEKVVGLVTRYRQGESEVCRKWADYNTKLCGGALSSLSCVFPTLRYNQFILPPVKLDYAKEILSSFFEN